MQFEDNLIERGPRPGAREILLSFLINAALATLAFGAFLIRDGGLLVGGRDFNEQQVVFSMFANSVIRGGEGAPWSWAIDLGSSFLGALSFYNLGSPWFWCSVLFPTAAFPYLVGILYITKYAVAGMTSFLFMRRYVKRPHAALLGSMLYAFSGFQSSNLLFYHFHDVTALFPLLLLGLDSLVVEGKRWRFALAVAVNALLNYFFFIGEVIFLVIYYIVRFLGPAIVENHRSHGLRKCLRDIGRCFVEGLLGGAMSAVLLVPSVLSVLQNSRASGLSVSATPLYDLPRYLAVIRAVLLPGEMMSGQASIYPTGEWTSCAAYLPAVGIVLALAFCLRRRKNWLTILLVLCSVMAIEPHLNDVFALFAFWYCRWYYMPIFFAAFASALVMDESKKYPVALASAITFGLLCAFALALWLIPRFTGGASLVVDAKLLAAQYVVAVVGAVCTGVILGRRIPNTKRDRNDPGFSGASRASVRPRARRRSIALFGKFFYLYLLIGSVCVATTAVTMNLYQKSSGTDAKTIKATLQGAARLKEADTTGLSGYRVTDNGNNSVTMIAGLPSAGTFCSTVSGSILRFYAALGIERTVVSQYVEGEEYLLSEAYSVVEESPESYETATGQAASSQAAPGQTAPSDAKAYRVEKTRDTNPIGFTYDHYMTASELDTLIVEDVKSTATAALRLLAMRQALIIDDDKEAEVSSLLQHLTPEQFLEGAAGVDPSSKNLAARQQSVSQDFTQDDHGFSCTMNTAAETYAFFSVPNDLGWKVTVNGENAEIVDVCGFMAVRLPAGENTIAFTYVTPGLGIGALITVATLAGWIVLSFFKARQGG